MIRESRRSFTSKIQVHLKILMPYKAVADFEAILAKKAPFMSSSFGRLRDRYGDNWANGLNQTLKAISSGDLEKLEHAINGYVRFALETEKLQRRFAKEGRYLLGSQRDAAKEVFEDSDYMFSTYLPGVLLLNYLWSHEYDHLRYFCDDFLPLIIKSDDRRFCDIGVGAGFYSRIALSDVPDAAGTGYDISNHALAFAHKQMQHFGFSDRWFGENRDVTFDAPETKWPFIMSIQILHLLDDPVALLKGIRKILAVGGKGFISVGVTAAEIDAIYVYNSLDEVKSHIEEAGFTIIKEREDAAYAQRGNAPVPRLATFIVE